MAKTVILEPSLAGTETVVIQDLTHDVNVTVEISSTTVYIKTEWELDDNPWRVDRHSVEIA